MTARLTPWSSPSFVAPQPCVLIGTHHRETNPQISVTVADGTTDVDAGTVQLRTSTLDGLVSLTPAQAVALGDYLRAAGGAS